MPEDEVALEQKRIANRKNYYKLQDEGSNNEITIAVARPLIIESFVYLNHLPLDMDKKGQALSVGCREGFEMDIMERVGFKNVVGIDIAISTLDQAKNGHSVVQADMHSLPFKNECFGFIYSRHSLEHSYDPKKVLEECTRTLSPGGILFVIVPWEVEEEETVPYHTYRFIKPHSLRILIDEERINILEYFGKNGIELWLIGEKRT